MKIIPRKLSRALRLLPRMHRPKEERIQAERRLRGETEFRKLNRADCVVVSYGKSGRTWLRIMLSRFYQIRHGLSERHLMAYDNLHRQVPAIPIIFFTHDNYLKDYAGHSANKSDYYSKRVILLVRHPADVSVSQYFQWKFRMRSRKMVLNDYPEPDAGIDLFDFVMRSQSGILKTIDFMNLWASEAEHIDDFLLVRYEDMHRDPESLLTRVFAFIGTPGTPQEVAEAVRFSSVENMRQREQRHWHWLSGIRFASKDRGNPDAYKVRRAKVGGYCDYFDEAQRAEIDLVVRQRLSPFYGYGTEDAVGRAANG